MAAIAVGALVLVRNLRARLQARAHLVAAWIPAGFLFILFAAALVQFAALASPILGGPTGFDGGIDRMW